MKDLVLKKMNFNLKIQEIQRKQDDVAAELSQLEERKETWDDRDRNHIIQLTEIMKQYKLEIEALKMAIDSLK